MTSPRDRRAADLRDAASHGAWAAQVLRHQAGLAMHRSRGAGEQGIALAALVESVARHLPVMPPEVAAGLASVATAVARAEDPPAPAQPWTAGVRRSSGRAPDGP